MCGVCTHQLTGPHRTAPIPSFLPSRFPREKRVFSCCQNTPLFVRYFCLPLCPTAIKKLKRNTSPINEHERGSSSCQHPLAWSVSSSPPSFTASTHLFSSLTNISSSPLDQQLREDATQQLETAATDNYVCITKIILLFRTRLSVASRLPSKFPLLCSASPPP